MSGQVLPISKPTEGKLTYETTTEEPVSTDVKSENSIECLML